MDTPMGLAQTLVRSVMRSFYESETRYILVIDALIMHSALRDDDLAYLMSMNTKDLHKLCGKLKEDRFLQTHIRSELREGQSRPVNRTYYYIDYRQTIDAIKWRVFRIDKDMQGVAVPANEKKEYFCSRCKAEWTQMEVLDSVSTAGFLCHRCGFVLTHDVERQSGSHQKSTRMNSQFKFITEILPKIDSVRIPDNTFDVAFENRRLVVRDATHQIASSMGVDSMGRPTAVKGMADTGPRKIAVQISSSNGPSEEEKAAEAARKEKIKQQNSMPEWMSASTITGDAYRLNDHSTTTKTTAAVATEAAIKSADGKDEAAIDDLFAKLDQEAAQKAKQEAEESSEEDDDDEFEDVAVAPMAVASPSAAGTPASTTGLGIVNSTAPVVPSPLRQSSLKRDASGSHSPTPEGRPPKKVKVEEPAAAVKVEGGDSDDDDLEFEDV